LVLEQTSRSGAYLAKEPPRSQHASTDDRAKYARHLASLVHVTGLARTALIAAVLLVVTGAAAQTAPPDAARELAPKGTLRAAINYGNPVLAQKGAEGPQGVSVDLARELGRRLGVPVELVVFEAAGKVTEAASGDVWDIAFLAIDPLRAGEIAFTQPYVLIEGAYLVRADSPIRAVEDVDRDGIRIAVGKGSAYDLYLGRALKHATLVHAPTSQAVIEVFRRERTEVAAGVKQQILKFGADDPTLRVLPGRFMGIEQAIGTPRGRDAGLQYLRSFVEDAKRSGFVAGALQRSGQAADVPP
jgi:polar amino acid transport system substrate-binding protein